MDKIFFTGNSQKRLYWAQVGGFAQSDTVKNRTTQIYPEICLSYYFECYTDRSKLTYGEVPCKILSFIKEIEYYPANGDKQKKTVEFIVRR